MSTKKPQSFMLNLLNGSALGIIVALVPGALLSELFKAISTAIPEVQIVIPLLTATNSLVGMSVGVAIGFLFAFTPIETISIGLATMLAGGAIQFAEQGIMLKGAGDILTMLFTSAIAVGLIKFLRTFAKGYAILIIPTLAVLVAGVLGRLSLPYFVSVTTYIGQLVAQLLSLEQTLLAIIIAAVFAVIIVSPISSVGIALAISLTGVGSGAANLGICACAFALAVAGRRVNPVGTCLAHFIGSPKLSMPNIMTKPKLLVPIIINAAILGGLASVFAIQGTPLSADFGLSGLVGPVNHLNLTGWSLTNILVAIALFIVAPVALAFATDYLFVTKWQFISPEDYKIEVR